MRKEPEQRRADDMVGERRLVSGATLAPGFEKPKVHRLWPVTAIGDTAGDDIGQPPPFDCSAEIGDTAIDLAESLPTLTLFRKDPEDGVLIGLGIRQAFLDVDRFSLLAHDSHCLCCGCRHALPSRFATNSGIDPARTRAAE